MTTEPSLASGGSAAARDTWSSRLRRYRVSQEQIVFLIAAVLFVVFSILLPGFLNTENLLSLIQSVALLGMLGLGMGLVVIGRGIDLAMVATMVMSAGWVVQQMNAGVGFWPAAIYACGFAITVGILVGFLIAYVEIPPIFATLAMATVIFGFARYAMVDLDVVYVPGGHDDFRWLGAGRVFGIPMPVVLFGALALLVHLFLTYTKAGRYIFMMGDNPQTARITGVPVRPMVVLQYVLSSLIGFGTGLVTAAAVGSMNTRLVTSTMVYDVILVVVLGGIGLAGGKGGARNVIVGTLLIGTMLNGMTIMNFDYTTQNIVKSLVLLAAIVIDTLVNPRDEQTSQQGDI